MTPSEELQKLLDERVIQYDAENDAVTVVHLGEVTYTFYGASKDTNEEFKDNVFVDIDWLSPEQAIAATVCEEHEMHICKRCGVAYELNIIDKGFGKSRFCPNCGHKELYQ